MHLGQFLHKSSRKLFGRAGILIYGIHMDWRNYFSIVGGYRRLHPVAVSRSLFRVSVLVKPL